MLPTNQVSKWAVIEGEIRPAGRNHYKVWTPNALNKFLLEKDAVINEDVVEISKKQVAERKARGGNRKVSGYKINPLFFVCCKDCAENNGVLTFKLSKVRQLNPTIAGKMFFKNLKYNDVKAYYKI
ncbi:MAG: hypothetical protein E7540_05135 [Ruminococcaceae bacterium]|nr:hypothetical protein [Oscillospiraceae bacterium]